LALGLSYFLTQRHHSKLYEQKRQARIREEKRWSNPHFQSQLAPEQGRGGKHRDGKDVKASFLTEEDLSHGIAVPQPRYACTLTPSSHSQIGEEATVSRRGRSSATLGSTQSAGSVAQGDSDHEVRSTRHLRARPIRVCLPVIVVHLYTVMFYIRGFSHCYAVSLVRCHLMLRQFDPTMLRARIERFWARKNSEFGHENLFTHFVLHDILTDRYTLINGFQLIRDELQFAGRGVSSIL
jgi:hypothetical protein